MPPVFCSALYSKATNTAVVWEYSFRRSSAILGYLQCVFVCSGDDHDKLHLCFLHGNLVDCVLVTIMLF